MEIKITDSKGLELVARSPTGWFPVDGFAYLASPFTHDGEGVETARHDNTLAVTARLIKDGYRVYSPIVHCYPIFKFLDSPGNFQFWRSHSIAMLKQATELWVLRLPGWESSEGVTYEINAAKKWIKIPIRWVDIFNEPLEDLYKDV